MNAGAVIAAKQNRYIRRFEERDVTDPGVAQTLTDLGCSESVVFRRLVSRGVIRETGDGRFYLDLEAAHDFRKRRRAMMLLALFIVGTVIIVLGWLL